MSQYEPRQRHPIAEPTFNEAYGYLPEPQDPEVYHKHLANVQAFLEHNKLKHFNRVGMPDQLPIFERVEANDNGYVYVNYLQNWWDDILDDVGIDDIQARRLIKDCHKLQIETNHPDLEPPEEAWDDIDDADYEGFIVGISETWRNAENTVTEELRWLVKEGCSPAEALDYWMCERKDKKQIVWAGSRRRKQPTISENIKGARDVISNVEYGLPEESEEQEKIRKEVYEIMEREQKFEPTVDIEEDE